MSTTDQLLHSIRTAAAGLSLTELLALHPALARRSAQRLVSQMVAADLVHAQGEVRARGKAAIETLMILNHKAAIEFLVENTDTAASTATP